MTRPTSRVVLVTGSGKRRVGWYVAEAFAREGYAVAVHFHRSTVAAAETVAHLRSFHVDVEAFCADVGVESEVQSLIRSVLERFGRLDVLVNCAAVWESKRLEAVTATDLRRSFDVNVLGTFLCAQQAGLAMVEQPEGGCIVNLGDWAEARPYTDYSAYFASKGAIPTLTRSLAVELAARNPNVRVNCILPGPVMMPPDVPEDERERVIRATLLQREGRPENVAQAVLALAQNTYITGVSLAVDGGRTISAGA